MRTGKEINDLYAGEVEAQTCGTCGNNTKDDVCMIWDTGLKVTEAGTCTGWQPIPVATTDVKSNVPWHHMGEPNGMYNPDGSIRTWTSDVEWYRGAIAKRDDLIRRMAFEMRTYPDLGHFAKYSALISEANELMGVK